MKIKRPTRHMLFVVFREDQLDSRTYRVPVWVLQACAGLAASLVLVMLLAIAYYAPILRAASQVPGLTREVARLETANAQVGELAEALDSVEAGYQRLRQMIGADIVPQPALGPQPLVAAPVLVSGLSVPSTPPGATHPSRWPLDEPGYVTRGASDSSAGNYEAHQGIDIAVREGSLVRASGGGTVLEVGADQDYGLYVLLRHPDGYESMYGHLSRRIARRGEVVREGEVVGLSGNTGRSTAPHLHFEIRLLGRPVDPAGLLREEP